jgi:Holliday junction resolvase-like predicted endonuclease
MANPRPWRSYHVGVAAEAFAAALFAQAGCDVLVQYGANQPEYDLMVSRADRTVKVSVKGSQDGGWGLIQNHKRGAGYHEAAERWSAAQSHTVVYCLVQFWGVSLGECPRVYLASVRDIVVQHQAARNGLGNTILYENHCFKKGVAAGCVDKLPSHWRFSMERLAEFLPA